MTRGEAKIGLLDSLHYTGFIHIIDFSLILIVLIAFQNPILLVKILRVILGLPFILFYPGYCLMMAAFPETEDLEGKARLALSFGLSFVLIPSLALVLDWLPWGITLGSVTFGTLVLNLLLMVITLLRYRSIPKENRFAPLKELNLKENWQTLDKGIKRAYIFILLLVIAFGAVAYTILAFPAPAERMTEFYILGDEGMAEGYPYQLNVDEPYTLIVGITNFEGSPKSYRVEAEESTGVIGGPETFDLTDGENIEIPLEFTPQEIGESVKITFFLYILGEAQPYRSTYIITQVVPDY